MDKAGLGAQHVWVACRKVVEAAEGVHVPLELQDWQSDYKGRGIKFHVDPIRYPFE